MLTQSAMPQDEKAAKGFITTRHRVQANYRALPVRQYAATDLVGQILSKSPSLTAVTNVCHSSRVIATTQSGSSELRIRATSPTAATSMHAPLSHRAWVRQTGSPAAMPSIAV